LGTKLQHDADDENMISYQVCFGVCIGVDCEGWLAAEQAPLMSPRGTLGKGNFQKT